MNKKVIYISLLTTTLSRVYWMRMNQLLEMCGSVFEHQRDVWVCKKGIKQYMIVFKQKMLSRIHCCIQNGKGDKGFQVQIKAKASFILPHITSNKWRQASKADYTI